MKQRPKRAARGSLLWSSKLLDFAEKARENAYAPYSNYKVGAAVLGADGQVYTGCNVENASYGLSICAERSAIFAMVNAGCTKALEIAVVTEDGGTPCGACRQVLFEFAEGDIEVHCGEMNYRLSELLPHGFKLR